MALLVDTWWADAVLAAGLELWAYIPFEQQPARWPRGARDRWAELRGRATVVRVVGELDPQTPTGARSAAVNRLLHLRDDAMLRDAGALVSVWERGRFSGGAHATTLKAARRRMPGVHIDPTRAAAGGVRFTLPTVHELVKCALYHRDCGHIAAVGTRALLDRQAADLWAAGGKQWRVRTAHPRDQVSEACQTCVTSQAYML